MTKQTALADLFTLMAIATLASGLMIKLMAEVLMIISMDLNILAIGKMTSKMDLGWKRGLINHASKAVLPMVKSRD